MNLKRIFFALFAVVIMLGVPSCNKLSSADNAVAADDFRFILSEDVINLNTASIRIKHNGSFDAMWVYMQTSDLVSDADALIAERVSNEYQYTEQIVARTGNNISLAFNGLDAKQRYRIIVKAIDKDGNLYGKAASLIFKTRRNPDVWEVNDNWSLTRKEERTSKVIAGSTEEQEYENYECKSKDQESYIILTLSMTDYQNYKKAEGHKDVKRTLFEDFYSDFMQQNDYKSKILKGDKVWTEERLRSGEYVAFMIGLDEDNELSGLYKESRITIEPEEPTEEYNKWKGWWEISFEGNNNPWTIYIDELDPNMWLSSIGWEPEYIVEDVTNMPVKLYYSKSTGDVYLVSQEVASGSDGSTIYYYGTFPYSTYQTVLDFENVRVAKANFTNLASTEAVIDGLGMYLTGVGDIEFNYSLFYIRYNSTTAQAISKSIPSYPWTMKKIDDPKGGNTEE
jgi:hypothetical protein